MVYNGKSHRSGWFKGTPISGKLPMVKMDQVHILRFPGMAGCSWRTSRRTWEMWSWPWRRNRAGNMRWSWPAGVGRAGSLRPKPGTPWFIWGKSSPMAELFRWVKYDNLPSFTIIYLEPCWTMNGFDAYEKWLAVDLMRTCDHFRNRRTMKNASRSRKSLPLLAELSLLQIGMSVVGPRIVGIVAISIIGP